MYAFNDLNGVSLKNTALCIGKFDGLHSGHRFLIDCLKKEAAKMGVKTCILTFNPHPSKFFGREILLINTPKIRNELFESAGVDFLVNASFDSRLVSLSPEDFFKNILIKKLGASLIAVGADYKFGADRSGDINLMMKLGEEYNVKCIFVDKLKDKEGRIISSTRIREEISRGDVETASLLLGRNFAAEGIVIEGDGRGKDLGFPTINMKTDNELMPPSGVYASETLCREKIYHSMTYIGVRPTVKEGGELRTETNIFNFNENIYGEFIRIFFIKRIRGDIKFSSAAELKQQLEKDKKICESVNSVF